MQSYKYVILGAGPSGLSFAHQLLRLGETSFIVLEKEAEPGGLCRSAMVDGAPLDIGGGHFLDLARQSVLELLFSFMPRSEWLEYARISRVRLPGAEVDYPLEASLWQLPVDLQIEYLEDIAKAGSVRGEPMPEGFDDWVRWKLGDRIAQDYMLPYNRKIWSMDLAELGTYWLYKLPDVSFRDTLRSCLLKQPAGSIPAHGRFLYPVNHGYGEIWKRMGAALNDRLLLSAPLKTLEPASGIVNGAFRAENIITTIPWPELKKAAHLPAAVAAAVDSLVNASITVDYCSDSLHTDAHWIYEPDEKKTYHRLLCRANFCQGSRGYWTESNTLRAGAADNWRHVNDYAYPVNTLGKPAAMREISAWGAANRIIGLGRWGAWEHVNSDAAVEAAMALAERLVAGG